MCTLRIASIALTILLTLATALPAAAAPAGPGTGTGRSCMWQGIVYPNGSIRKAAVVVLGKVIRYDLYQCSNAAWIYIGSSDD